MKKIWKKAMSFAATVTLLLGTTIAVQAAALTTSEKVPDTEKPTYKTVTSAVEVTISNVKDIPTDADGNEETLAFATYQVIYATYDAVANALEYHLTDWAKTVLVSENTAEGSGKYATEEDAIAAISQITTTGKTDVSSPAEAVESDAIVNTLAAAGTKKAYGTQGNAIWTRSGDTETASLPVGAYLVIPSCNGMSFLNMLVSVDVSGTTGTTENDWVLTANDASLKGRPLGIDKKIVQTAADGAEILTDAKAVGIGDTVNYKITADVPRFPANATQTTFKVVDTPKNLKIDAGSVTVKAVKADGTEEPLEKNSAYALNPTCAELTENSSRLVVDFSACYKTVFLSHDTTADTYSYPYDSVEITYSATVLSSAEVGSEENSNTAKLVYDKDPYTDSDYEIESPTPKVYTYGLVITKRAEDTTDDEGNAVSGKVLANAQFQIRKVNEGTESDPMKCRWNEEESAYVVYDGTAEQEPDDLVTNLVTGADGTLTLKGLDAQQRYVLEEVKAPSGYSLNKDKVYFEIHAKTDTEGKVTKEIKSVNGYESDNKTEITSDSEYSWSAPGIVAPQNATISLSLTDTRLFSLPATGGMGIVLFTVGGVVLLLAAAALIIFGKKHFFSDAK